MQKLLLSNTLTKEFLIFIKEKKELQQQYFRSKNGSQTEFIENSTKLRVYLKLKTRTRNVRLQFPIVLFFYDYKIEIVQLTRKLSSPENIS